MTANDCAERLEKGEALYERACKIIPWGTQTGSKRPPEALRGAYPPYIARGEGAYVWDIDRNRYIDHKLGCGPVTLGHAYPVVVEAAEKQLRDGTVYGSAHPSEVTLAELLIDVVPCAEMVRFLKTGAEGTSAAVRLARGYTGRELVVSSGYHGWHDWSLAGSDDPGIPDCVRDLTVGLPYGDYQRLEDIFRQQGDEIAAVVFSAPYQDEPASIGRFLKRVRELCDKRGVVLVYDEIVTGFRVAVGGLQELVGVVPDLAVFSKGMANGFPISAVVGSRQVMKTWEEKAIISSTFAGEAVSMAAAIASVTEVKTKRVPDALARRGAWLKEQALGITAEHGLHLKAVGFDAMPNLILEDEDAALTDSLHRGLLLEGVMPYVPIWYLSYSHDMGVMQESRDAIARACVKVCEEVK